VFARKQTGFRTRRRVRDIREYEAMAKLDLPQDERAAISARADGLIAGFKALEGIDVAGVAPLVSVLDITLGRGDLREDTHARLVTREELLENAPEQYDGYFQVPRTLEGQP
jgi:aspartyl/glutamyl-tRNA(Asn/Gln) amidotransferase C subunit